MKQSHIAVILTALFVTPLMANSRASAETALVETCIVGAEVHTIVDDPFIGTVCFSGDRITQVFEGVASSGLSATIDGDGMVLTPGLVETHTELGLVEIGMVEATNDMEAGVDDPIRAAFRVADAINADSTLIPIARTGGVTSVVSSPSGGLIAGQSVWLDLVDGSAADMIVNDRVMMVCTMGAGGDSAVGESRATAMLRYRELFEDVTAYTTDPVAYDEARMRELSASRLDLQALAPILDGTLPVLVRAHRRADIESALRLASEYGLDIAILGGAEAWGVADALAASQTPVLIDPMANLPATFEQLGARDDGAALLAEAGVPIVIASGETHNARLLRQYAGNAVRAGLPHADALRAVTLGPAELTGMESDYGTIEVGKVANLVLWTGDPFEFSSFASTVVIRGEVVERETRQDALFERYR